jgi:signal transduction histidine kinase
LYREAREAILAREEFLSIAAHELKTPLTSVKASAQLLRRWSGDERIDRDRNERLMEQLGSEIGRLETLVSDLLDASRIHQGRLDLRLEPIDLVQLAWTVIERFEHVPERTHAHQIIVEADRAVTGFWDRSRLDQVVTNLVSNALKYSPDGGVIRLRVDHEGDEALLSVADQGIGISEHEQEQLFQPFARAESIRGSVSGTGLGLFIAERIIEHHGGTISVTSSPGQGTILAVRIPLIAGDGPSASRRDETGSPEGAAVG